METFSMLIALLSLLTLLFQTSHSKNGVADAAAEWRSPNVHVRDSISEKLAIAVSPTLLGNIAFSPETPPLAAPPSTSGGDISTSPTYTWPFHSKQGNSPSSAPTSGGVISISPTYTRPFHSKQANPPSFPPSYRPPPTTPWILPDTGEGMPFINSNPAVPLPTGEPDTAAKGPLPKSGHHGQEAEGLLTFQIPVCIMVWLMLQNVFVLKG